MRTRTIDGRFGRSQQINAGTQHRHSGIAMLTPATVHEGNGAAVLAARHGAMLAAHAATPERFINGQPTLKLLPAEVWINRPATDEAAA